MNCVPANIEAIAQLNEHCDCVSMQPVIDNLALCDPVLAPDIQQQLAERSNLFAETAVFISQQEVMQIQAQINAIEAISVLPRYVQHIRDRDSIPHYPQASTRGVFMGYDFHLTADGPKLIEVNTNAGGAFIMQFLLSRIPSMVTPCANETLDHAESVERHIIQMIISEMQLGGRSSTPASIAIIDENPESQYLFPDMRFAQELLERNGIKVTIASPSELKIERGKLMCNKQRIDFIYNRTTDFSLSTPANAVLKQALIDDLAVVSPNPLHHALYADKRNPGIWQNTGITKSFGVSDCHIEALKNLPTTDIVTPERAADFWPKRKSLFFKPRDGFGSRAVYRGNKVTRKVWEHISKGGYIAQSTIPPAIRKIDTTAIKTQMKFDLRVYSYQGKWLLGAARIYQGQTTNFRTPGGGFAPLIYMDDPPG